MVQERKFIINKYKNSDPIINNEALNSILDNGLDNSRFNIIFNNTIVDVSKSIRYTGTYDDINKAQDNIPHSGYITCEKLFKIYKKNLKQNEFSISLDNNLKFYFRFKLQRVFNNLSYAYNIERDNENLLSYVIPFNHDIEKNTYRAILEKKNSSGIYRNIQFSSYPLYPEFDYESGYIIFYQKNIEITNELNINPNDEFYLSFIRYEGLFGAVTTESGTGLSANLTNWSDASFNNVDISNTLNVGGNTTSKNFIIDFNETLDTGIDNVNIIKKSYTSNNQINYNYNVLDLLGPPRVIDLSGDAIVTSTSITIDLSQIIQYKVGFFAEPIPKINSLHIDISAISSGDTLNISFNSSNGSNSLQNFTDWINLKTIILTQEPEPEPQTQNNMQINATNDIITCHDINFISDNSYNIFLYLLNDSDYYNEKIIEIQLQAAARPSNNFIITITNPNSLSNGTLDNSNYILVDNISFNIQFTPPNNNGTAILKYHGEYFINEMLNNNKNYFVNTNDIYKTFINDQNKLIFNALSSDLKYGTKYGVQLYAENIQNISGDWSDISYATFYTGLPLLPINDNPSLTSTNISNYNFNGINNNKNYYSSTFSNTEYSLIDINKLGTEAALEFSDIGNIKMHNIATIKPSSPNNIWKFTLTNTYKKTDNTIINKDVSYQFNTIEKQDNHQNSDTNFIVELSDNYLTSYDLLKNANKYWYKADITSISINFTDPSAGTSGELILNISGAQEETFSVGNAGSQTKSINYTSSFKYAFDNLSESPSFSNFNIGFKSLNVNTDFSYICGIASLKENVSFLEITGVIDNIASPIQFYRKDKQILSISDIININNDNRVLISVDNIPNGITNNTTDITLANYDPIFQLNFDFNITSGSTFFTFTAYNIVGNTQIESSLNIYRDKDSITNTLLTYRKISPIDVSLSNQPEPITDFTNNIRLSNYELILKDGYYDGNDSPYNFSYTDYNIQTPSVMKNPNDENGNFRYATFLIKENEVVSYGSFEIQFQAYGLKTLSSPDITVYIYFSNFGTYGDDPPVNYSGWYDLKTKFETGAKPGQGIAKDLSTLSNNLLKVLTPKQNNNIQKIYIRIGIKQGTDFKFDNITYIV